MSALDTHASPPRSTRHSHVVPGMQTAAVKLADLLDG